MSIWDGRLGSRQDRVNVRFGMRNLMRLERGADDMAQLRGFHGRPLNLLTMEKSLSQIKLN